jgi:hypothetical protein
MEMSDDGGIWGFCRWTMDFFFFFFLYSIEGEHQNLKILYS